MPAPSVGIAWRRTLALPVGGCLTHYGPGPFGPGEKAASTEQLECTNCHVRSFTASAWAFLDYPCDDCGHDAHLVVDPVAGEVVPAKDDEPLEEVALRG